MSAKKSENQSYFELAEHNTLQIAIFYIFLVLCFGLVYITLLPIVKTLFENMFSAIVYCNTNEQVTELIDTKEPIKLTNYYLIWAVDIYKKTASEARYWFEPLLSLFVPTTILSLAISLIVSTMLPGKLGFVRQKIEREIVSNLERIYYYYNGYHSETGHQEIAEQIFEADMRELQHLSEQWKTPLEDLRVLYKALHWSRGSFLYRLIHINDSFTMYMRFYFTVRYSNTVLGFVYIGAAVLIIIIGLRGLKFIPSTKPSLIFFALGLEFSLLIFYAFTLMYSRQDEELEPERSSKNQSTGGSLLSGDYGSSKEIENLLRVFIKSKKEKIEKK